MPKSLEIFNNPCAPVSPLTDEEDNNKTTPSKISTDEKPDDEPGAKRSLVMQLGEGQSSSSSSSLVSSPVSTRVQPYPVLPKFTNNHSVLTHIPTPIPYPTPPSPVKQPGFDVYGALGTTPVTPSLVPSHPRVSAVIMQTHMSPEKQGFHPVNQSGWSLKDTSPSPQKVGDTSDTVLKSPKQSPCKIQGEGESPEKRQGNGKGKTLKDSPKKGPRKKNTSPKKPLNSSVNQEDSKTSKNTKTVAPGLIHESNDCSSTLVFCPTELEFKNPLKYIESIKTQAEPFGMCIVVPPKTWQVYVHAKHAFDMILP